MRRLFAAILLLCAAGIASGCSTYVENEASLPFEPIYPSAHVTPEGEAPTGGIFKSNGGGLFASDIRARDVGDILTVALNETFRGYKGANCGICEKRRLRRHASNRIAEPVYRWLRQECGWTQCRHGLFLRGSGRLHSQTH